MWSVTNLYLILPSQNCCRNENIKTMGTRYKKWDSETIVDINTPRSNKMEFNFSFWGKYGGRFQRVNKNGFVSSDLDGNHISPKTEPVYHIVIKNINSELILNQLHKWLFCKTRNYQRPKTIHIRTVLKNGKTLTTAGILVGRNSRRNVQMTLAADLLLCQESLFNTCYMFLFNDTKIARAKCIISWKQQHGGKVEGDYFCLPHHSGRSLPTSPFLLLWF